MRYPEARLEGPQVGHGGPDRSGGHQPGAPCCDRRHSRMPPDDGVAAEGSDIVQRVQVCVGRRGDVSQPNAQGDPAVRFGLNVNRVLWAGLAGGVVLSFILLTPALGQKFKGGRRRRRGEGLVQAEQARMASPSRLGRSRRRSSRPSAVPPRTRPARVRSTTRSTARAGSAAGKSSRSCALPTR